MKCVIIPVVTGATGIVTRGLRANIDAISRKHSIDSLQKTVTFGTSHTIREVLQSETLHLSGGEHRWFKRSAKEKWPMTRYSSSSSSRSNNKKKTTK
jgi:hypothetical protein